MYYGLHLVECRRIALIIIDATNLRHQGDRSTTKHLSSAPTVSNVVRHIPAPFPLIIFHFFLDIYFTLLTWWTRGTLNDFLLHFLLQRNPFFAGVVTASTTYLLLTTDPYTIVSESIHAFSTLHIPFNGTAVNLDLLDFLPFHPTSCLQLPCSFWELLLNLVGIYLTVYN